MSKEIKPTDEQIKTRIKIDIIKNNMVYQDELNGRKKDITEQEIEEQMKVVNDYLKNDIVDTPTYILDDDLFIMIIAILTYENPIFNLEDIDYNTLLQRYDWYKEGENFFNDPKAYDILDEYGAIIKRDDEGFYELDDTITNKVIKDSGFYITDDEAIKEIKQEIFNTWENQKEILTQDSLNKYSEQRNGINFKHFIFCEEYIKRGKIKPTCEHLGISRNTAYLWLKDDNVQRYLKERQDEIKQETDNTFLNTYRACFNALDNMINSSYMQNSDKIKAIDTFLKHYTNIERLKQPNTTYEE